MSKLVLFIFILLSLYSCGKKSLDAKTLAGWVHSAENGLLKEKKIGQLKMELLYEPADYLMISEDSSMPNNEWASKKNGYKNMEHFHFRLSHLSGGNVLEYDQTLAQNKETRTAHYNFSVKNDFKIAVKNDTIPCVMTHYARTYNLSPVIEISLAFPKVNKENDIQVIYEDTQYNLGRTKFLFKSVDLLNIPTLKKS